MRKCHCIFYKSKPTNCQWTARNILRVNFCIPDNPCPPVALPLPSPHNEVCFAKVTRVQRPLRGYQPKLVCEIEDKAFVGTGHTYIHFVHCNSFLFETAQLSARTRTFYLVRRGCKIQPCSRLLRSCDLLYILMLHRPFSRHPSIVLAVQLSTTISESMPYQVKDYPSCNESNP